MQHGINRTTITNAYVNFKAGSTPLRVTKRKSRSNASVFFVFEEGGVEPARARTKAESPVDFPAESGSRLPCSSRTAADPKEQMRTPLMAQQLFDGSLRGFEGRLSLAQVTAKHGSIQ